MPRHARLDAPDSLHHVMVRGLERHLIFRDDADRADFVARLAALAAHGAFRVYAWALPPNHAHHLVWTGMRPLARAMRSLLSGYGGAFDCRPPPWPPGGDCPGRSQKSNLRCGAPHQTSFCIDAKASVR